MNLTSDDPATRGRVVAVRRNGRGDLYHLARLVLNKGDREMRNKLAVAGALVVTAATCLGIGIAQGASSPANSGAVHHAAHQPAFTVFKGSAATLFAVVNFDGSLARGYGTLSSKHEGVGSYQVLFKRGLRKCAYVATLGTAGSTGVPPTGYAGVVGRNGHVNGVYVQTFDQSGSLKDEGFHLVVSCPPL
jgi:hypothetical protein